MIQTMAEPRSIRVARDGWMTDSRAYNLIWLGRWMERAESIARGMDTAAKHAEFARSGANADSNDALLNCLCDLASSFGVSVERREEVTAELLLRNPGSSVLQSLIKARLSATQVAPVELMRALTEAILEVERVPVEEVTTPQQVIDMATAVIGKIASASQVIEDEWFGRETLSDEEIYRRFAQQQQQQQMCG